MKLIQLTSGDFAKVDDEDYEYLMQFTWYLHINNNKKYARCQKMNNRKIKRISMHRMILGLTDPTVLVDHKNGDGLDNQKGNIRIATSSGNNCNRGVLKGKKSSKYKGVHLRQGKYWIAKLVKNKKEYIEFAETEMDAAKKYNKLAALHHGSFAKLNIL